MSELDQNIESYYEIRNQLKELSTRSRDLRKQLKTIAANIISKMKEVGVDYYENVHGLDISLRTEIDKKK